jgi:hypothetical protein
MKIITWARCVIGNELYQLRYKALGISLPAGKKKAKLANKFHQQKITSPNIPCDDDDDNESVSLCNYHSSMT